MMKKILSLKEVDKLTKDDEKNGTDSLAERAKTGLSLSRHVSADPGNGQVQAQ